MQTSFRPCLSALLALLLSGPFHSPAAEPAQPEPPRVTQPPPPSPGSEAEELTPNQHLLFTLMDLRFLLGQEVITGFRHDGRRLEIETEHVPGPLELAWEHLGRELDWLEVLRDDLGFVLSEPPLPGLVELARLRREIEEVHLDLLRLLGLILHIPEAGDAGKLEPFRACVVHELESLEEKISAIRAAVLTLPRELLQRQFWNLAMADRFLRETAETLATQAAGLKAAAARP